MINSASTRLPQRKDLRNFGLIMGSAIAVLFILIPWLKGRHEFRAWALFLIAIFAGLGLIAPQILKPVYRIWIRIGDVLGWINSRIILGVVFYVMISPIAWIRRLCGFDSMGRRYDRRVVSYRVQREDKDVASKMESPF